MRHQERQHEDAEFGPGGYLPKRAAHRARKIVLRERMGLGWPIAAGAAALLIVGIGGALLLGVTGSSTPSASYEPVANLAQLGSGAAPAAAGGESVVVVSAGPGVQVLLTEGADVRYCRSTRRLESRSPDQVWRLSGRLVGGTGESLRPLPTEVVDGTLYADPSRPLPAPAPDPAGERPGC